MLSLELKDGFIDIISVNLILCLILWQLLCKQRIKVGGFVGFAVPSVLSCLAQLIAFGEESNWYLESLQATYACTPSNWVCRVRWTVPLQKKVVNKLTNTHC